MLPDAPERFSTITDCFSDWVSPSDSTRARMSVEPPAAQGTIRVIGLSSGQAARLSPAPSARDPGRGGQLFQECLLHCVYPLLCVPVSMPAGIRYPMAGFHRPTA